MDERLVDFGLRAAATTRRESMDTGLSQVVRGLDEAGVVYVLLKGPAVAGWLYGAREARRYDDVDLLVGEDQLEAAARVLECLGFARTPEPDPVLLVERHHRVWERRGDGVVVELHWTLVGIGAPAAEVWSVLCHQTDRIPVGDAEVPVLSVAARTLHLALHAAQHQGIGKPVEDLKRGIARIEFGVWEGARALAFRLDAVSAFAAGLRTCPDGWALAARLGLPAASVYWRLRASSAPVGAGRLWYVRHAPGWRNRWRLVVWFLPQTRRGARPAGWMATVGDIDRASRAGLAVLRAAIGRRRSGLAARRSTRSGRSGRSVARGRWGRPRRVRLRA
jgi:hypothetical protein